MNKLASDLKRVAVLHRCAVLLINHVSSWRNTTVNEKIRSLHNTVDSDRKVENSEIPPSAFLGRYWLSVPDLRFYMKQIVTGFELTVTRNVYGCNRVKCVFLHESN